MGLDSLAFLQTGCLVAFALLLLLAAWQDVRTLRIADRLSAAVVAAFVAWAGIGLALDVLPLSGVVASLGGAIGVFAFGMAAFAAGLMGGGDVKLLSAASLFAGPALLVDFLLIVALAGGGLALALLAGVAIGSGGPGPRPARSRSAQGEVPFGPAIAMGGLWVAASLAVA